CALEDIDVIITDDKISEQMIAIVEEAGVDLIIVK
ncbi:MAG: DeoR/GlpR transcriptional regulator, partial [Alistipes sp.]|nr:DeoR/GlpR transcriptional regulator [Alistipes sp.]